MNTNRRYVVLKKDYCTLDSKTGMWSFKLPDDFVNSRSPNKRISVLNFMYYATWIPRTTVSTIQIDFTELHSPTLCDGNYNQNDYIGTLCYTYNSVGKTYPIKSNPQYFLFYFVDTENEIVKQFYYGPGASGDDNKALEERFTIDLELIW